MEEDSPLSSDEEREMLERILTTAPATAFRAFVCDRAPVEPGDSVLGAGCGPGFETAALAERVGEAGRVLGVDVNDAVLAAARDRCADLPQASFARGDATDLPAPDEAFDVALAKQVLPFVDDVGAVLGELRRVLEPGGRAAVATGVSGTHAMHAPTERIQRANELYFDTDCGRSPGTRLVSQLPEAGLPVEEVVPKAKLRTEIDAQLERGIAVHRSFLESSDEFEDADVAAWERDLRDLDAAGRFLFCSTSLLYVCRKPE